MKCLVHGMRNEPAFPSVGEGFGNPLYSAPGMTLRQWYVGMAIQAILLEDIQDIPENVRLAFAYADAMLEAKEAQNED